MAQELNAGDLQSLVGFHLKYIELFDKVVSIVVLVVSQLYRHQLSLASTLANPPIVTYRIVGSTHDGLFLGWLGRGNLES